jgi:hypothetical protein
MKAMLHIIHLITNYSFLPHTSIQPFPHDARPFSPFSLPSSHPVPESPLDSGTKEKATYQRQTTQPPNAMQKSAKTQRKTVKLPPLSGVTHPLSAAKDLNPPPLPPSSSADSVRHSQL